MLILARKEGEALLLTYQELEIQIVITDIRGAQAKVGIEAPPTVKVVREELLAQDAHPEE